MDNQLQQYRGLLNAIEDDIDIEDIEIYSCPYCGYQVINDSSNFSPHQFNIGNMEDMKQHIIDDHLEELKDDYGSGDYE